MAKLTLVFSDLDGTLIDHDTYEFDAARDALAMLAECNIPLILNTSKTFVEVLAWQRKLNIVAAFIIENGSALVARKNPRKAHAEINPEDESSFDWAVYGTPIEAIHKVLKSIARHKHYDYAGISSLSVDELVKITGLSAGDAVAAKQRKFSEPIVWRDSKMARDNFAAQLHEYDLRLLEGGRFFHIMGKCDKGVALQKATQKYAHQNSANVQTIALGDSPNDEAMLDAADFPVVVKNSRTKDLVINSPRTLYTNKEGPAGWQEAFDRLRLAKVI